MDKIDEILSRFPTEARHIYNTSPLLHRTVHAIANGVDPYTLLYDVIKIHDNLSQEFFTYVKDGKRPPQYILTTQERIDEIKSTGKGCFEINWDQKKALARELWVSRTTGGIEPSMEDMYLAGYNHAEKILMEENALKQKLKNQ